MNYFNYPLKTLGDKIGLPKLECDLVGATDDQVIKYCERDVEIIKRAFTCLVLEWQARKLGNFRTSAAGLSLQNFRHWHCDSRVAKTDGKERYNIVCDPESKDIDFERDGYFGGRIDAFYYGTYTGTVYHLDVRSMYPSIMANGYYPVERLFTLQSPTIAETIRLMPARSVMAECFIDSIENTYPVRYKGRQYHARGRFWTVLCGRELYRALATCDCKRVGFTIVYRNAPLFRQWVTHWHDLRLQSTGTGDSTLSLLAKLILNSLHGKFGQRGIKWQDSQIAAPLERPGKALRWGTFLAHNHDLGTTVNCRVIDGSVMVECEGDNPEHSFPAISAMIAADVREKLRDLINLCPPKSVLYTAVDSLIVTEPGFKALLLAGELAERTLGKLQIEGQYSECEVRSMGCYRLDEKWTASGLWGRAEMDYQGRWTAQDWRYNDVFNFDDGGVININTVSVNQPRANPKGELLLDGWVEPTTINRDKEFYDLPIAEQRRLLYELG
jgi:hypothetical protein